MAFADGVMLHYDPAAPSEIIGQKSQQAWIEHEGGREKLTLAVRTSTFPAQVAWIVPVPAPAKDTQLTLVEKLPDWGGQELRAKARFSLFKFWIIVYIFFALLIYVGAYSWLVAIAVVAMLMAIAIPAFGPMPGTLQAVDVAAYAHAELGGLVSELVEAKDAQALEEYLKARSCTLPKPVADKLPAVLDGKTSLVVSWAVKEKLSKSLAVQIDFPAERPFYPMKLTSVYGDKAPAVDLKVQGWRKVPGLKDLRRGYYDRYTRVLYSGPGQDDWTFDALGFAPGLWLACFTAKVPILANILLLLFSGIAAAFLVGSAAESRPGPGKLVILGASMLLPYYGPVAVLRRWGAEEKESPGFWVLHLALVAFVLLSSYGLFKLWPVDTSTAFVSSGNDGLIRKSNEGATKGNLGAIRSDLSIYYGDMKGRYPADPYALTIGGKYMKYIPTAKTPPYHADSNSIRVVTNAQFESQDFDDSGGWGYVADGKNLGTVFVNCTHTDSKTKLWAEY